MRCRRGGNAATAGTFGTIQVNSRRQLRLHADQPFDTTPDADNGANTEVAESFTYVVTDANGNTRDRHHHGQHRRRRSDGARPTPTAWIEGAIVTGNVLTDGTDDVFGADGATTTVPAGGVVGFAAGSDTSDAGV